jgi:hypothetical protein
VIRREGDRIVLDGRANHYCVLTLEGLAVTRLFDALGSWLGERPCVVGAVPGRDGAPADHAGPGVARGRVPPVAAVLGSPIRPDAATGVTRVACDSPKVQAWSCAACGGRWWFSVVTPRHYLERLAGEVVLRKVAALVEEAPGLSDGQLWARLITVLAALDQHAKTCPG